MLDPGTVLQGRYTIDQMLGQGGRGIVYLARQDMLGGRRVAIKETHFDFVLPEEHAEAVAQFQREARLLASLAHPNLVDVKDFFEENGNLYLVMDFVEGETLEELLERSNGSPLALEDVFNWADQICDVLDCLHQHHPPIIFRDLKPGNIMLDAKGNLRLIDFGIARVLEPDSRDLTERAGTVGYAPYEQHAGKSPDARTDIYALGATLYDLVTGHPPPSAVAIRTGEEALDAPRELNPHLPQAFEVVILKMMGSRPEERYPSVNEARKALRLAYKTMNSGIVRRVSLDGSESSRRMAPLTPSGTADSGRKRFFQTPAPAPSHQPAPGHHPPPSRPGMVPPSLVTHQPAVAEDSNYGKPLKPRDATTTSSLKRIPPHAEPPSSKEPEKPQKRSLFSFLNKDPAMGSAFVLSPADPSNRIPITIKRYKDSIVGFVGSGPLPVNSNVTLLIMLKNVKDTYSIGCALLKETRVDAQLEYLGRMQTVPQLVDKILAETYPPPEQQGQAAGGGAGAAAGRDGRRAPRFQTAFQVMSRQLPGYKALSTNISLTGIQLDVREEVKVGTRLDLKLDFDDFRFREINCEGEVKWCRPGEERDWLIGIAFVSLSEPARETIKQYIQLVGGKPLRM